jgi:hypothetical protein
VWLAIHSVAYDAARELWYADVPIDLNDAGRPLGTNPFVQLAVAAYQENGLAGRRVSPIVQCDMPSALAAEVESLVEPTALPGAPEPLARYSLAAGQAGMVYQSHLRLREMLDRRRSTRANA